MYYIYIICFIFSAGSVKKYISVLKIKKFLKTFSSLLFYSNKFFYQFIVRWFIFFIQPFNLFQVVEFLYSALIFSFKCQLNFKYVVVNHYDAVLSVHLGVVGVIIGIKYIKLRLNCQPSKLKIKRVFIFCYLIILYVYYNFP